MRELLARIRDWFRRDRLSDELGEELRFHRELLERDARTAGALSSEASGMARRQLGNETRVHEDARDRWSIPWLDHLQQDVRYALRGLRRSPGFTSAVVLTLGLGVGANAAMFNVIDQLMFRPFPYLRDPGAVHRIYLQTTWRDRPQTGTVFPYARYLDLRRWTTSFSHMAAFTTSTYGVGSGDGSRERSVLGVGEGFFEFFDARPAIGRFFLPTELTPMAGANVAVISHAYWTSDFGARDVIGRTLQVGSASYTIVGVAPEGFVGVGDVDPPAVFIPMTAYAANDGGGNRTDYTYKYNWDWAQVMVRRKPGVSVAAASADLSNAAVRSWNASRVAHPLYRSAELARPRAIVGPLKTAAGPDRGLEARTLLWVSGVALLVLLIACANVANLLLARALRRRREIALRLALGVSRGRLMAQALTESAVLATLGCAAGIVIAQWGGSALRHLFVSNVSTFDVATDWRTLTAAMAAAMASALFAGMTPLFFAGHTDVASTLKSGAREGTHQRSRARTVFLITQSALCVVLLVGAGLFVRSLQNVRKLHLGYDVDKILAVEWERRGTPMDSAGRFALRARLLRAALEQPDVEYAAWVSNPPFQRGTSTLVLAVPGIDSVNRLGRFTYQIVSSDYFTTIGTRIVRGRSFTQNDRVGQERVMVVSQAMAERLWPGREALGQCVRTAWSSSADTAPCTMVIGIAENAVHQPAADYPMRYYLPEAQADFGATLLLLRMRRDPAAVAEDIRRTLQALMPGQALVTVQPASEIFDAKRRSWLVGATMFVAFGILALGVAAVGLYGVIAYSVAQRMHELGVRIALGAQAMDVTRLIVGQGVRVAAIGVVAGSVLALAAGRWIQPLLFQQSAHDPLIFSVVGLLLIAVALLASSVPAIRATRADPNAVLRVE